MTGEDGDLGMRVFEAGDSDTTVWDSTSMLSSESGSEYLLRDLLWDFNRFNK